MEKHVSLNSINKFINFYKFRETPYIENLYTQYVLKFKASRLDTLNRRNAIQTLVPIHSTPEKARHNLDFVIGSNPPSSATFQHQLSNPYESFTEMHTGIQIPSKSIIKTADVRNTQSSNKIQTKQYDSGEIKIQFAMKII